MDSEPLMKQVQNSNDILIYWLPPSNNNGMNETIFYDIECMICVESICNKTCTDILFTPSQYNLTQTSVRVSGLVVGDTCQFRIFPKDSLNSVMPRSAWTYISTKVFNVTTGGTASFLSFILTNVILIK